MHTMYCKYCPEILSKACMNVLGQNVLPVCAKKIKEEKFKSHNSENTPCHHRFKSTPSGTMVECVDCGAKFTYNKGW